MAGYGPGSGNYGTEGGRERGARRRKLAAMAGSVYRAGAVAVNEIKESYNQTRSGEMDTSDISNISIPSSFPDIAITTNGSEQMVLFPSYAKRHIKKRDRQVGGPQNPSSVAIDDQEYWRDEWARHEDEKAIMDVDVRGWIYNPHKGPMTRRNRVLIGLARQLSGIPAPRLQQADNMSNSNSSFGTTQRTEEEREKESIAREAREIERKGWAEELAAQQGGYSERPKDEDSEEEGDTRRHDSSGSGTSQLAPPSPTLSARAGTFRGSSTLTDAELAVANANLMARIGPFMTTPLVQLPIVLFFFNDKQSQSRTVMTDDSGHFAIRAALDFIPTHVRVLAGEDLSCTEPVQVIEPRGVSLISDIDDTIKRSNISLGAKEIFRNTFVRDLGDLTIDGVKDWYNTLHNMGVRIHYCSNSPWQLYPVIATYFKLAGLPPGSLHLKRYTGMLQGIFEPVAERKKGTLEKIMNDFPERKFLLVGDSGEADLEVYTELAVAYPSRIKAIFIRDVTTPEQAGYFDSAYDPREARNIPKTSRTRQDTPPRVSSSDDPKSRPALPPRAGIAPREENSGSLEGDLIDFSEDPPPSYHTGSGSSTPQTPKYEAGLTDARGRKPPHKPPKPSSLQSAPTTPSAATKDPNNGRKLPPAPPPRSARSFPSSNSSTKSLPFHPLSQMQNSSDQMLQAPPVGRKQTSRSSSKSRDSPRNIEPPPPPPPRRRGTPSNTRSSSPRLAISRRRTEDSDVDYNPLPGSYSGATTPPGQGGVGNSPNQGPINKKLELWRRRLERAQDTLSQHGVPLYTWRRGDDVVAEALGIVKEVMRELGIRDGKS